jgi:hypothetical protein
MDLRAGFEANPALPRGSEAVLHVTGSDGVERRFPLARRVMTVRAGLADGGNQTNHVRWELVRCAGREPPGGPPPVGYTIVASRVVGWSS